MNSTKVSIIIPVYNVEFFLPQCIESLLKQTYDNIELIFVDDCSTDNSKSILDNIAKMDKVQILSNDVNKGLSGTRNHGIEHATGECIMFVDSDDVVAPNYVETALKYKQETNSSIVVFNYARIDEDGKVFDENVLKLQNDDSLVDLMVKGASSSCNKIFDKDLFDIHKYNENIYFEDEDIIIPLLHVVEKVSVISDVLYYYRSRRGSITFTNFRLKHLESRVYIHNKLKNFFENKGLSNEEYVKFFLYKHTIDCILVCISYSESKNVKKEFMNVYLNNLILEKKNIKRNKFYKKYFKNLTLKRKVLEKYINSFAFSKSYKIFNCLT